MGRSIVFLLVAAVVAAAPAAGFLAQTPKRGGSVGYGVPFPEFACFTVARPSCGPGSSGLAFAAIRIKVLEAPFEIGPDHTWRPKLVSGATFTRNRPFTVTYRIRDDAHWSDGVPITADDFIFTYRVLRRYLPPDVDDPHRAVVRSVRAVEAKTVRAVLRERFADWRALFGSILPAHALRGEDLAAVWRDRIDNPKTGAAIGSGPFLVERWDRGKQLVLRQNRPTGRRAVHTWTALSCASSSPRTPPARPSAQVSWTS